MKLLSIFISFLFFNFIFSTEEHQPEKQTSSKTLSSEIVSSYTISKPDYTIYLDIVKSPTQDVTLVITMKLYKDSYFISAKVPKKEASGRFNLDLGSYKDVEFKGELLEFPGSIEAGNYSYPERDMHKWRRKNTTYKQELNIKTNEDFKVFGRLQFTIEPRCTFEENPFGLEYKNGKFKFFEQGC